MDPVTVGLGAAGLLSGMKGQKKAEGQLKAANANQAKLTDRLIKLYDILFGKVKTADDQGQFDPAAAIAQLTRESNRNEATEAQNLGGAFRTAGYAPGDSELGVRMTELGRRYKSDLDDKKLGIRRQSFMDKLNAYSAIGGQQLGGPLNAAAQQVGYAQNNLANAGAGAGGFFQSLMGALRPNTPGLPSIPMQNQSIWA